MILITTLLTLIVAYDGTDYLGGEGDFSNEANWVMN
jgi:hypothetical protein